MGCVTLDKLPDFPKSEGPPCSNRDDSTCPTVLERVLNVPRKHSISICGIEGIEWTHPCLIGVMANLTPAPRWFRERPEAAGSVLSAKSSVLSSSWGTVSDSAINSDPGNADQL